MSVDIPVDLIDGIVTRSHPGPDDGTLDYPMALGRDVPEAVNERSHSFGGMFKAKPPPFWSNGYWKHQGFKLPVLPGCHHRGGHFRFVLRFPARAIAWHRV